MNREPDVQTAAPTVDQQHCTDTAADLDQDHVTGAAAKGEFGKHHGVGIVGNKGWQARLGYDRFAWWRVFPAEVGGGENDAVVLNDTWGVQLPGRWLGA